MTTNNVFVKSEIYSNVDDPFLIITCIWNINNLRIEWAGFDMKFDDFFNFRSLLRNNKKCYLGGGGNSDWYLIHNEDSDHCILKYSISGSGGDSDLQLNIENEYMLQAIDGICSEITLFKQKYPNKTRF